MLIILLINVLTLLIMLLAEDYLQILLRLAVIVDADILFMSLIFDLI